ncbi:MAG: hypothetical protein IPG76_21735 [Acidobacteria bacterium]|nr:hypothetical protein [Acidobacteriota bacterium]
MILLIGRKKISRLWPFLLLDQPAGAIDNLFGKLDCIVPGKGILATWIFFTNRERLIIAGLAAIAATLIFLTSVLLPQQFATAQYTLSLRFDPDYKLAGIPPGNMGTGDSLPPGCV